jgi:hypothetical protein
MLEPLGIRIAKTKTGPEHKHFLGHITSSYLQELECMVVQHSLGWNAFPKTMITMVKWAHVTLKGLGNRGSNPFLRYSSMYVSE